MHGVIDEPAAKATVDPLCLLVRGWVAVGERHAEVVAVELWQANQVVGETAVLYDRPDVVAALNLPAGTRCGYEVMVHHRAFEAGGRFTLRLRVRFKDGQHSPFLAEVPLSAIPRDYRMNHFGTLLDQRTTAIQRESNIFATGPSQSDPNPELTTLLHRHLPAPPARLVDVGCGFGTYGQLLRQAGYDWQGVEIDRADCAELTRRALPHVCADAAKMPFADGAFDAALCLEVLEHVEDPRAFLREVKRVAPRRLLVSVPNCELLGYLWDYLAAPWHMLESTHVNYFTRWSLSSLLAEFYPRVEARTYSQYPLRTVEGTPLYYHLFAMAWSD